MYIYTYIYICIYIHIYIYIYTYICFSTKSATSHQLNESSKKFVTCRLHIQFMIFRLLIDGVRDIQMTPEFVRRIRHAGIPRTEHVRRKKQGNILDQVGCHGRLFKWTLVSQNLKKKIKVHDISPTECVISRELSVWRLTNSTRHQEILRTQWVRENKRNRFQDKAISILQTPSHKVNESSEYLELHA